MGSAIGAGVKPPRLHAACCVPHVGCAADRRVVPLFNAAGSPGARHQARHLPKAQPMPQTKMEPGVLPRMGAFACSCLQSRSQVAHCSVVAPGCCRQCNAEHGACVAHACTHRSDAPGAAGGRRGPDLKTLIKESQSAKRRCAHQRTKKASLRASAAWRCPCLGTQRQMRGSRARVRRCSSGGAGVGSWAPGQPTCTAVESCMARRWLPGLKR